MKEWLIETLGLDPNFAGAVQVIIAFVVILTLIGIFTWILARIKGMRIETARRSRQPRLAVMDSTPIDNQRRLVLVRRDAVEHLILVGGETDIVVEQTIVRGAPIAAHPQRQPFPAAVPAPQAAPAQPAPPHPPQVQQAPAQAMTNQPAPGQSAPGQPVQAAKTPGAAQAPAAGAQRPRPAPQQRPTPPPPQRGPAAETPPRTPQQQAKPQQPPQTDPNSGKVERAKTGLVGAAAGALGFGGKKPPQASATTAESAPSAEPIERAVSSSANTQQPPRQAGPAERAAPPSDSPSTTSNVPADIDLEQAIGEAVAAEPIAPPHPGQQTSAPANPQPKLSPKDELAHQLEELLSASPPVKAAQDEPAKPANDSPPPEATEPKNTAPEIRSPATPEAPKQPAVPVQAAPVVAPPTSPAPRQNPAPVPPSVPQQAPDGQAPDRQVVDQQDVAAPKVEADPATAVADRIPGVSPPTPSVPRPPTDKTIPGGIAAPKVEPRVEPQMDRKSPDGDVPKIAAIPSAPPVSSASAPSNSSQPAPEPRIDAPEPPSGEKKSDSIASIEEEMAKLLSELSGPPKT